MICGSSPIQVIYFNFFHCLNKKTRVRQSGMGRRWGRGEGVEN